MMETLGISRKKVQLALEKLIASVLEEVGWRGYGEDSIA